MTAEQAYKLLVSVFGTDRITRNKDISPFFTLRTQAVAELYLELRTRSEWISFATLRKSLSIPILVLGGGSNLAIVSSQIPGLTIRNQFQHKEIVDETEKAVLLKVSSGYIVSRLAKETAEAGYEGFEYHFGLPGTLGGGIYMNSKWTKPDSWLGDRLESATLLTRDGGEKTVNRDYFAFSYGYSRLQDTGEIFLEGVFRLTKSDPQLLAARMREAQRHRNETQPKGAFTCGCFFKNISEDERARHNLPTKSAGYLIDKAGLKNFSVGDFRVSDIHANFIINQGGGTPQDLRKLVNEIKKRVKDTFGITLREEVIVL